MEDARSLVTDHCTTLQEKCIQRVARKYTPDDFKSGMYFVLLLCTCVQTVTHLLWIIQCCRLRFHINKTLYFKYFALSKGFTTFDIYT